MKLYKEIAKIREEIERKESTTIKSYGGKGANIERFLKLISHGWNCENAGKFAIRRESDGCVDEILKILLRNVKEKPKIGLILQSLNREIERLARTVKVRAKGSVRLVNMIKNKQHTFAQLVVQSLEDEQRYDVIKKKEGCKSDCSGNTHGEGCKAGYNLLMLALDTSPDGGLLPSFIADFVFKHQDLEYKAEIAMGKREPEIYGQTPNSIRLAAATGKRELGIKLLRECLLPDHCYRAFLEVGPPKIPHVSAMASVLERNGERGLKLLSKVRPRDEDQKTALKDTLKLPEMRNNFLELKMTQEAIEYLNGVFPLRRSYLIPKPSELSRPTALIFYNTFAGADHSLPETKKEAECLQNALQSLGWGDDEIQIFPEWTFDELIDELENSIKSKGDRCSLFLLYITSHGETNRVCGISESEDKNEYSSGSIHCITESATSSLPAYIPKVLIFDTCRTGRETIASHTIMAPNTLKLHASVLGQEARDNTYIQELAKQITEWADCRVSFDEMHKNAAGTTEYASVDRQNPHMEATAKGIFLRRYDNNESRCVHCKKDIKTCYRECVICDNCFRWCHLACAGLSWTLSQLRETSTYTETCPKCNKYKNDCIIS